MLRLVKYQNELWLQYSKPGSFQIPSIATALDKFLYAIIIPFLGYSLASAITRHYVIKKPNKAVYLTALFGFISMKIV